MSENGIRCPKCNCGYTRVIKTVTKEVRWGGRPRVHTRRYRQCQNQLCMWSYTTTETYEDENNLGFPHPDARPEKPKGPKTVPRNPLTGIPRSSLPENPYLKPKIYPADDEEDTGT